MVVSARILWIAVFITPCTTACPKMGGNGSSTQKAAG